MKKYLFRQFQVLLGRDSDPGEAKPLLIRIIASTVFKLPYRIRHYVDSLECPSFGPKFAFTEILALLHKMIILISYRNMSLQNLNSYPFMKSIFAPLYTREVLLRLTGLSLADFLSLQISGLIARYIWGIFTEFLRGFPLSLFFPSNLLKYLLLLTADTNKAHNFSS